MSQRRQFHLAFYGRVGRIGELGEQRGRKASGWPTGCRIVCALQRSERKREQRAVQAVLRRHGPDSVLGFGMEDTRALKLCLTASIPCFRTRVRHACAVTVFLIN